MQCEPMMKRILINWKWLPVPAIDEDEEPTALVGSTFVKEVAVDKGEEQVILLNLQREEAEFEDEYEELYDERNALLATLLAHYQQDSELLVFLHKNAPHYYGDYDLQWFSRVLPQANFVLFGGGEDFLYDLHNASSGLLDQVGNFSLQALTAGNELKSTHFDGIWQHYVGNVASAVDSYSFLRKVLEELLPVFDVQVPSDELIKQTKLFLEQNEQLHELSAATIQELKVLVQGKLPDVQNIQLPEWVN